MKKFLFLLIIITAVVSCRNHPSEEKLYKKIVNGEAQGTYYSITYYDTQNRNLKPQFDSLLHRFDLSASNYVDSSVISKVNANIPVELDDVFKGNFMLAQKVSELTGGDFDITVRPLVELWGFGKRDTGTVTPAMVDSILTFTGYQKVHLKDGRIVKDDPRIQLDYNALAQGYSVDVMAGYLRSLNIDRFLIDIGGELYASSVKPDSSLWKVGIERPGDNEAYGESLTAIVSLKDRGLATSGNYRKFYIKNGVRYSHTIDPHTGRPARRNILSATVIAADAATADAFATAFMVMGIEKAKAFLKNHPGLGLEAFLIYSDSLGNYRFYATDGMRNILEKE